MFLDIDFTPEYKTDTKIIIIHIYNAERSGTPHNLTSLKQAVKSTISLTRLNKLLHVLKSMGAIQDQDITFKGLTYIGYTVTSEIKDRLKVAMACKENSNK